MRYALGTRGCLQVFVGIFVVLTISCASKRVYIEDWSFGTRTYGQVEATGEDFFVVRFTRIEAFGYPDLSEWERKLDLLKLYRCQLVSWCERQIGEEVVTEARGGKRKKDPIDYEVNFIQLAEQDDIPLIRSYRLGPR